MKLLQIIFVFNVVYFHQLDRHSTNGQYFENPNLTYQPITFDMVQHGSLGRFNIEVYDKFDCMEDLLNCWQMLKMELMCLFNETQASLCDAIKQGCLYKDWTNTHSRFACYGSGALCGVHMDLEVQNNAVYASICSNNGDPQWTL